MQLTPETRKENFLARAAGTSGEVLTPETREEVFLQRIIDNAETKPEEIAEAVGAWLEEHVDPETGYVIDNSLTVEGAAADAKATGDAVDELKSAINDVLSDVTDIQTHVFTYTEKNVISNIAGTRYTTSTFSGWISDFVAPRDMSVDSFLIPIKSRSNAITKVRMFYGTGSFMSASTDYVDMDVDLPANTLSMVTFKKKAEIRQGDYFFVGYACNQYCDMPYTSKGEGVTYGGSAYKTGGTMPATSKFPSVSSYDDTNFVIALSYVEKGDIIPLSSIPDLPQDKLQFAEHHVPENLYDYESDLMTKKSYWYYSTSIGATMAPEQNQYTTNYTAITTPIYNAEHIYLTTIPETPYSYFYWCGFCDKDMKLLAYYSPGNVEDYDMDVPDNAVYFIATYCSTGADLAKIVISANEVSAYIPYEKPYYLLKECRAEFDEGKDAINVKLRLPSKYDLVVGDTFQLFYKGIIDAVNDEDFYTYVDCAKGNTYQRMYEITPSTAGNVNATVYLYDNLMRMIDSKQVALAVHSKPSSPVASKTILCVGDSLTVGGAWPKEFCRRLVGTGGTPEGDNLRNISFIGTLDADGVGYEGYGGWKFTNYNTASVDYNAKVITCTHDKTSSDQHSIYKDANNAEWKLETIESGTIKILAVSGSYSSFPSTGTLTWVSGGVNHSSIVYTASENAPGNPFWNSSESKVDFEWYAGNLGVSSIDYVFVLLGWNNAGSTKSQYKAAAQTFIDNVQTGFPDAKIVLMGIEIPARDGLGVNYGATGVYSKYYELVKYVHDLDDWYDELASENQNVYHINVSGQFDTKYNMLTATRPVNTRNSTTETYQANGVHPATSGKLQIADAAYRSFAGIQ